MAAYIGMKGYLDMSSTRNLLLIRFTIKSARKIFEFHLARWANNPQILLALGTSPLAQVFKLINNLGTRESKSKYRHVLNLV